jgi:putative spermidine/putrescine transport system substrate-binding protein
MSTVWNGRPFAAAVGEGIDFLGVAWDGGILHTSRWGIPKGAPNTEAAYAALAYYLTPKVGVAIGNAIGYPNTNKSVIDEIDPEAKKFIATEPQNLEGMTVQDDQWWLDNGPDTEERFADWLGE